MSDLFGEKNHPATPHRRQQARQQGQTPRSLELASTGVLLTAIVGVYLLGQDMAGQLAELTTAKLSTSDIRPLSVSDAAFQLQGTMGTCLRLLLPIAGLILGAGLLAHWGQAGFTWHPDRVAPNLKHVDPSQGFRRLFSASNGMQTLMGLLKMMMVISIVAISLSTRGEEILACYQFEVPQLAQFLVNILFWISLQIALGFGLLALVDYGFQYWKHEQDLRMTDQELREEMRMLQGDPQLQARRRLTQRPNHSSQTDRSRNSTAAEFWPAVRGRSDND